VKTLRRASAGYLWRHPWQLLLALVGIGIGVAVIVAVDLANSSARKAFRLSMDAIAGESTHQVVGGPSGLPETLYVDLRVAQGVTGIAPVVEGRGSAGELALRILGVDPFAEREFRSYTVPAGDGEDSPLVALLTEPGAVLASPATAERLGAGVGGTFAVTVADGERQARLVGLLDARATGAGLDNVIVTDIATAQVWLDAIGRLTRIDARLPDADTAAFEALLPGSAELLRASGRTQAVAELSNAFMINLTAMSLLALLVGVFLIYNSMSFAVLQRRQLIGTLRALGLTRREAVRLILGEALVLGIAGSAAGLAAGALLGNELLSLVSRSINDLYFRVTVTDVSLESFTLAKGAAAGLLATLAAAAVPAVEAASFPPSLALNRITVERRTGRHLPWLTLAGLLLAGSSVPILLLTGGSLVAGLVALFLAVLGLALTIPWCVRGLSARLAPAAGRAWGLVVRLAVDGIGANLSRTGVAIVALAVAVSATVGVSVMVDSFRAAVSEWIGDTLRSDLYVSAAEGSLGPALAAELRALPGVEAVSSSRRVWIESGEGRTRLVALDMAPQSYAGTELIEGDPDAAWAAFENEGEVLVSESYAYREDARPGDSVRFRTDRGERAFRIAGIYRSYDANPHAVLMSRTIYDMFWDDDALDSLGVYLAADTDADTLSAALREIADGRQRLEIRTNAELEALSLEIFDQTFVITNVLYWLAVGVAIVGILAAMLALQMERSRELATLRALGVTRLQLGGMLTLQSGLIGLLAGLAALPLGLLMALMLIDVINRRAFGWSMPVSIEWPVLGFALALAAGSALAAGLYPAWRAGQSRPALAMRED